jgi:nitroreductase/predicted SnoaL-like aldol condensation-catalyzing enzyme
VAVDYHQHCRHMPQGRAGLEGFVAALAGGQPALPVQPELANPPAILVAEGDMVVIGGGLPQPDPDRPGEFYDYFIVDTFKVRDGKLAEHWSSINKIAPPKHPGAPAGTALSDAALGQLFGRARTHHKFADRPVDDDILRKLHEQYKWGPTSLNSQPGRVTFVRSAEAKERLRPALMPGNVDKTMAAPVTAIVAYDTAFFEQQPNQFPPNAGAPGMFANNARLAADTAVRNSTLQGAYLMVAARALGLAVGPMSGFNPQAVNETFFADGRWKANFLVNLGWPDPDGTRPRGPRLVYEDAVRVL